jgi:GTP cyclohydrolase I
MTRKTQAPYQAPISEQIRKRIQENGGSFFANHNISKYIEEGELELLVDEVATKFEDLLNSLVIDVEHDHNSNDTPRRLAKMLVNETFSGRYMPDPKITAFPNASRYDQVYVVGPITLHSTCSHHWQPIIGKAYIGVAPGASVMGLSKFHRSVRSLAKRPTIQEELTQQIADKLCEVAETESVAVQIEAEHFCVKCRGVEDDSSMMITNSLRGSFRDDKSLKDEFLRSVSDLKRNVK